jgi:SAM-dependent methyltransferase
LIAGVSGERCERCGEDYPRVGGVEVLAPLPRAVLVGLREQMLGGWALVESRRRAAGRARPLLAGDAEALTRSLDAMQLGQALLERLAEPVLAHLREHPATGSLPDLLAQNHAGWSFAEMLPNAYADWAGKRDPARDRIAADVARHARDRSVALVLGCGGAALVGDLAGLFDVAYGVDLSLPALLLARRLLDGESLRIPLMTSTALESVSIATDGSARPHRQARLVVGDAAALPFADGSMSVVVTPYLLDIVPDPSAVLREVNRVLYPEGLWIQHGLPFRLREDPPALVRRTGDAWPALVAHFGFDAVAFERVEHLHHDVWAVDPWARVNLHAVLYAVSRKRARVPRDDAAQALASYFAGETAALRARIPSLAEIEIEVVTRLGPGGRELNRRLRLGGDLRLRSGHHDELLALLAAIDGARSVAALAEALSAAGRARSERDIVLVLDVLRRMGFVELTRA